MSKILQASGIKDQLALEQKTDKLMTAYEESFADALAGIYAQKIKPSKDMTEAVKGWAAMRMGSDGTKCVGKSDAELEHETGNSILLGYEAKVPVWVKDKDFERWAEAKAKLIAYKHTMDLVKREVYSNSHAPDSESFNAISEMLLSMNTFSDRLAAQRKQETPSILLKRMKGPTR